MGPEILPGMDNAHQSLSNQRSNPLQEIGDMLEVRRKQGMDNQPFQASVIIKPLETETLSPSQDQIPFSKSDEPNAQNGDLTNLDFRLYEGGLRELGVDEESAERARLKLQKTYSSSSTAEKERRERGVFELIKALVFRSTSDKNLVPQPIEIKVED